jgi:hypothetical protein
MLGHGSMKEILSLRGYVDNHLIPDEKESEDAKFSPCSASSSEDLCLKIDK